MVVLWFSKRQRQLMDKDVYRPLTGDPRWDFERKLADIVNEGYNNHVIDQKLKEFLIVQNPKIPVLYLLPKVHKQLHRPPGRPIVSGRDSLFNHVSIFLDRVLREYATSAKSFIQDTSDFLCKIQDITAPWAA